MTELTFAVLMLLVLGWAVVSDRLARWNITGPLVFSVFGYVLANRDWGPLTVDVEAPTVHLLAEVTLALLLFADAARVNLTSLRHDAGLPGATARDRPSAHGGDSVRSQRRGCSTTSRGRSRASSVPPSPPPTRRSAHR